MWEGLINLWDQHSIHYICLKTKSTCSRKAQESIVKTHMFAQWAEIINRGGRFTAVPSAHLLVQNDAFPQHPVCLPALFNQTMCCSRHWVAVQQNPCCDCCWATCTKGASVMLIAQDWPWTVNSPLSIQRAVACQGLSSTQRVRSETRCWRCNCAVFPFESSTFPPLRSPCSDMTIWRGEWRGRVPLLSNYKPLGVSSGLTSGSLGCLYYFFNKNSGDEWESRRFSTSTKA